MGAENVAQTCPQVKIKAFSGAATLLQVVVYHNGF